jgi:hypothetical protein
MPPGDIVPAVDSPISAASCETKPEADLEKRKKRIETCLLSLAGRSKSPAEPGNQDAAKEYELAVASLAELIHHTAFREDAGNLVPFTDIAIHDMRAEPPNLVLATDLITEIEGRLFMYA